MITKFKGNKVIDSNLVIYKQRRMNQIIDGLMQELEDAVVSGTSITVNDSANAPAKLSVGGNTYQDDTKMTYVCNGTETGDYYFSYDSTNYQFTMPTISANDILVFDTIALKLYLGETEITTTTGTTGTLITLQTSPNSSYPQTIHNVSGNNQIKIQNKNHWNPQKVVSDTHLGNVYITTDGKWIHFVTSSNRLVFYPEAIKTNTQYTLKTHLKNGSSSNTLVLTAYYTDGTTSRLVDVEASANQEYDVTASTLANKTLSYIRSGYTSSKEAFIKIEGTQLEQGTTATEYVPHQEQIRNLNLLTGMEMCKIDNCQDKFIKQNGKWYFEKNIIKRMLQEFNYERNVQSSTGNIIFSVNTTYKGINADVCVLSSHFKGIKDTQGNKLNSIRVNSAHNCYIIVEDNEISETVTTFKNWLEQNNVYAYFILNTPTLTEITDTTLIAQLDALQNIMSYFEQTNVDTISAGDLETVLTFDYKKTNNVHSRLESIENRLALLEG